MLVLLDVVIGVSFVYLLLALICTTANEWVASVRGLRGRTLDQGVRRMLGPLADEFFDHPLIASLSRPGKQGQRRAQGHRTWCLRNDHSGGDRVKQEPTAPGASDANP